MLFFGDARFVPGADFAAHYDDEVRAVGELRERGVIQRLYRHLDGSGAMLILRGESAAEVEGELATLPFVRLGLMRIPINEIEEL